MEKAAPLLSETPPLTIFITSLWLQALKMVERIGEDLLFSTDYNIGSILIVVGSNMYL